MFIECSSKGRYAYQYAYKHISDLVVIDKTFPMHQTEQCFLNSQSCVETDHVNFFALQYIKKVLHQFG